MLNKKFRKINCKRFEWARPIRKKVSLLKPILSFSVNKFQQNSQLICTFSMQSYSASGNRSEFCAYCDKIRAFGSITHS